MTFPDESVCRINIVKRIKERCRRNMTLLDFVRFLRYLKLGKETSANKLAENLWIEERGCEK